MPTFLDWFEVDWDWPELDDAERAIVRRYHAVLSADSHHADATWLADLCARASGELPGRTVYARGEDIDGEFTLIAREGQRGDADPADFDEGGMVSEPPRSADYKAAGVDKVCQPLFFSEDVLSEIERQAARQDRSLSWLAQKAWRLARDEIRKLPRAH